MYIRLVLQVSCFIFRLALAALHFNENSGRNQALTKDGQPQFRISFPKSRRREAIAKEIKTCQTFGYVDKLMMTLLENRKLNKSYAKANRANSHITTPKPIAQSTPGPRPKKQDVIQMHVARFKS